MSRTAYIDADVLLYTALYKCTVDWDGDKVVDPRLALEAFQNAAGGWISSLDVNDSILCMTDRGNVFRNNIYPAYKGQRPEKPKGFEELVELVRGLPNVLITPTLEADDVIGIHTSFDWERSVAVGTDKDFFTVPCAFYRPGKMKRPLLIREDTANLNWLRQAMTGDTIDNYKGIPKIGEKKAEAILPKEAPLEEMWPKVVEAFQRAKLTADDALLQARLARILRKGDINSQGPILWTPPSSSQRDVGTDSAGRQTPESGDVRSAERAEIS